MKNKYVLWTIAILLTIFASVYQKLVGPTHPDWMKTELNGTEYSYKLRRSNDGAYNAPIKIEIADQSVKAKLHFKHYPEVEGEEYKVVDFSRLADDNNVLFAELPHELAGGKFMYYIEFITDSGSVFEKKNVPIVLRYRDPVPDWVLIPHIFFMFFAMLLSNLSGLQAAFGAEGYKKMGKYALMSLIIGGFIFGPIMQKYSFGEFWTGIPFGFDLTDNKTLIAVAAWVYALYYSSKHEASKKIFIFAAVATFVVYMIPHSVLGSELDRESGKVVTGIISFIR